MNELLILLFLFLLRRFEVNIAALLVRVVKLNLMLSVLCWNILLTMKLLNLMILIMRFLILISGIFIKMLIFMVFLHNY